MVRVVAPSDSLSFISEDVDRIAKIRFEEMGLNLTFGKHAYECNEFDSSSIESRVKDLHNAFKDDTVNAIIAGFGGYNSNQLLDHLDWDLIKSNPKILIGYSDITALQNAILKKLV